MRVILEMELKEYGNWLNVKSEKKKLEDCKIYVYLEKLMEIKI